MNVEQMLRAVCAAVASLGAPIAMLSWLATWRWFVLRRQQARIKLAFAGQTIVVDCPGGAAQGPGEVAEALAAQPAPPESAPGLGKLTGLSPPQLAQVATAPPAGCCAGKQMLAGPLTFAQALAIANTAVYLRDVAGRGLGSEELALMACRLYAAQVHGKQILELGAELGRRRGHELYDSDAEGPAIDCRRLVGKLVCGCARCRREFEMAVG